MQNAAKDEMLVLIRSLRSHVEADRELPGNVPSFCMQEGNASPASPGLSGSPQIFVPGSYRRFSVPDMPDTLKGTNESDALNDVRMDLGDCRRCALHKGRKNIVFGEGNPHAELVFVGEAPGADEDDQGRPFVGRAGQLLTKIIEAMKMQRQDVYICNILKCRPPGNRNPESGEIAACEPFLVKQLEAIRPKVICALGTFAAQTLLKNDVAISLLRGRFHRYHDIPLMPTYHPAYLLRNPSQKRQVWEDVQQIMNMLAEDSG
ncbi:MAG: uracil-DNA glycosylase [Syntrophus sp. (in: bacteria)]